MTYVFLGIAALFALLVIALVIAIKVSRSRGRRVKELEGTLATVRSELRRQREYQQKKEEAQHNADEKKETLHTGNAVTDFNNSLELLHGASKNRGN
jgi:uncharacterized protein YoxC